MKKEIIYKLRNNRTVTSDIEFAIDVMTELNSYDLLVEYELNLSDLKRLIKSNKQQREKIDQFDINNLINAKENCYSEHLYSILNSEKGEEVLGVYERMNSPGNIKLNFLNIRNLFWGSLNELIKKNYQIRSYEEYRFLALLTIYKTLHHEFFHHYCDISYHLYNNFQFDSYCEEPLAVAWSRMKNIQMISSKNNKSRLKFNQQKNFIEPLYRDFLDIIYSYSVSPYKEWTRVKDFSEFCMGVSNYIYSGRTTKLEANGVNFEEFIINSIDTIIENSNAINIIFDFSMMFENEAFWDLYFNEPIYR